MKGQRILVSMLALLLALVPAAGAAPLDRAIAQPIAWNQVNADGFGDGDNRGAYSMAVFGDYLYVGTYHRSPSGAEVWRNSHDTTWNQVNTDGFGVVVTL